MSINTEKSYWKRILCDENVSSQDKIDAKTIIDLQNIDNTSDANKPVSSAQQSALNNKVDTSTTVNGKALSSNVTLDADDIIDTATTNKFATAAQLAKVDYISVTQAVDLDQMETDIAALANGMVYKGSWDASSGSFPGAGTAKTGWFYTVSMSGTVDGVVFDVNDAVIAITDNASTTTYTGNWNKRDATDAVQDVVGLVGSISKSSLLTAINVEDGADVTDATNVAAAGAAMKSDTSTTGYGFVVDEDDMSSNSDTLLPTQQSVKAYVDNHTFAKSATSVAYALSPYSASWGELIDLDDSAGSIEIVMPSAGANDVGKVLKVQKTVSNSNSSTFSANGAETLEGGGTLDIQYETAKFQCMSSGVVRRVD